MQGLATKEGAGIPSVSGCEYIQNDKEHRLSDYVVLRLPGGEDGFDPVPWKLSKFLL